MKRVQLYPRAGANFLLAGHIGFWT